MGSCGTVRYQCPSTMASPTLPATKPVAMADRLPSTRGPTPSTAGTERTTKARAAPQHNVAQTAAKARRRLLTGPMSQGLLRAPARAQTVAGAPQEPSEYRGGARAPTSMGSRAVAPIIR
jgi:hypothetical protein